MEECTFCGKEVERENCGPTELGDECQCCGLVLVARNDEEDQS